jgi:Cys-tRNA(Pro)/Cys-tRNA(Cys) deacylase
MFITHPLALVLAAGLTIGCAVTGLSVIFAYNDDAGRIPVWPLGNWPFCNKTTDHQEIMSKTTRATQALQKAGIFFTTVVYDYDPSADRIGMQAAEAIGAEPRRVLKTLMAEVDGKPVCVVVPSDKEVSMKKLAAAFGGKSAQMMKPADAERLTGYHVGGISPFGQKRKVPTAMEEAALSEESVFINGGQRGLQVNLKPADALKALEAKACALVA